MLGTITNSLSPFFDTLFGVAGGMSGLGRSSGGGSQALPKVPPLTGYPDQAKNDYYNEILGAIDRTSSPVAFENPFKEAERGTLLLPNEPYDPIGPHFPRNEEIHKFAGRWAGY